MILMRPRRSIAILISDTRVLGTENLKSSHNLNRVGAVFWIWLFGDAIVHATLENGRLTYDEVHRMKICSKYIHGLWAYF